MEQVCLTTGTLVFEYPPGTESAMNTIEQHRPIDPQVRIGHIHLKVADLERALAFYCDVLGFELIQRYGTQAAFIGRRLPPHWPEHMGEPGRDAAVPRNHRLVSRRHPVPDPACDG